MNGPTPPMTPWNLVCSDVRRLLSRPWWWWWWWWQRWRSGAHVPPPVGGGAAYGPMLAELAGLIVPGMGCEGMEQADVGSAQLGVDGLPKCQPGVAAPPTPEARLRDASGLGNGWDPAHAECQISDGGAHLRSHQTSLNMCRHVDMLH